MGTQSRNAPKSKAGAQSKKAPKSGPTAKKQVVAITGKRVKKQRTYEPLCAAARDIQKKGLSTILNVCGITSGIRGAIKRDGTAYGCKWAYV